MHRIPTALALLLGASLVLPACTININKSAGSTRPSSSTTKPNSGSSNKTKPNSGPSKSASSTKPNSSSASEAETSETEIAETSEPASEPAGAPASEPAAKPPRAKPPRQTTPATPMTPALVVEGEPTGERSNVSPAYTPTNKVAPK